MENKIASEDDVREDVNADRTPFHRLGKPQHLPVNDCAICGGTGRFCSVCRATEEDCQCPGCSSGRDCPYCRSSLGPIAAILTAGDTTLTQQEFRHVVDLARHVVAVSKGLNKRSVTVRDVTFATFILELVREE